MPSGSNKDETADKVAIAVLGQRVTTVEKTVGEHETKFASKADVEFLKGIVFKGAGTIFLLLLTALLSGKFLR